MEPEEKKSIGTALVNLREYIVNVCGDEQEDRAQCAVEILEKLTELDFLLKRLDKLSV